MERGPSLLEEIAKKEELKKSSFSQTKTALALAAGLLLSPQNADARPRDHATRPPETPHARHEAPTTTEYTISFGKHKVIFKKFPHGVEVKVDQSTRIIFFKNADDFTAKMKKILDHELGLHRQNISAEIKSAYQKMRLDESRGSDARTETTPQPEQRNNSVELGHGTYQLDSSNPPPTYLLVRNANTSAFYCLSLAQETMDIMYGMGTADKVGLYSSGYAEQLDFSEKPVLVEKFDPQKHRSLKKGTILRFAHTGETSHMTHVGIMINDTTVEHIIGDTLYVQPLNNIAEGWVPVEVITPQIPLQEHRTDTKRSMQSFKRRTTLEQISVAILKNSEDLKRYRATVEEIIYRLNRDRFKITSFGGETVAELKKTGPLKIPREWKW